MLFAANFFPLRIWLLNKKLACCSSEGEKETFVRLKMFGTSSSFILVVARVFGLIEIFRRFSQIFHEPQQQSILRIWINWEDENISKSLVTKSNSIHVIFIALRQNSLVTTGTRIKAKSQPKNILHRTIDIDFHSHIFLSTMTTTLSARGEESIN